MRSFDESSAFASLSRIEKCGDMHEVHFDSSCLKYMCSTQSTVWQLPARKSQLSSSFTRKTCGCEERLAKAISLQNVPILLSLCSYQVWPTSGFPGRQGCFLRSLLLNRVLIVSFCSNGKRTALDTRDVRRLNLKQQGPYTTSDRVLRVFSTIGPWKILLRLHTDSFATLAREIK